MPSSEEGLEVLHQPTTTTVALPAHLAATGNYGPE
jgi:hypothetical protein